MTPDVSNSLKRSLDVVVVELPPFPYWQAWISGLVIVSAFQVICLVLAIINQELAGAVTLGAGILLMGFSWVALFDRREHHRMIHFHRAVQAGFVDIVLKMQNDMAQQEADKQVELIRAYQRGRESKP